jgi:enterochelin esterase-like enzyme
MRSDENAGACSILAVVVLVLAMPVAAGHATSVASPGQGRGGARIPAVVSPEVSADGHMTFRIYAPQAQSVRLTASDIPGLGRAGVLTKGDDGVWSVTVGPVEPGAYRYAFNVDGVPVIDPRSPATSESNNNVWSVAYVAGSPWFDSTRVAHGAVASVTYYSSALHRDRRMHVYTPPGYETGDDSYPVFYLLHGAGDSDDAWTSVGRAGFILDNLIAAGRASSMIVVMPAGHTNGPVPGVGVSVPSAPTTAGSPDAFTRDFLSDVMPYIESHYRVRTDRQSRAIAGLSMGGSQTLNVAMSHLDRFAYIGVFSSGILGGGRRGRGAAGADQTPTPPFGAAWEQQQLANLDDASLKTDLRLVWFSTGVDDRLIGTTRSTVELLRKHGFDVELTETTGGHTWINWRNYLVAFAPRLFR